MTVEFKPPQTSQPATNTANLAKSDVLLAQTSTVGSPAADLERIYKAPPSNTSGSQIMKGKGGPPANGTPGSGGPSSPGAYPLYPLGSDMLQPGATVTGTSMPFTAARAGLTQDALARSPGDGGAAYLDAMIATKQPVTIFVPGLGAELTLRYEERSGDVFVSDPNRPDLGEQKWTSIKNIAIRDLKVDRVSGGQEKFQEKYPDLAREVGMGTERPIREQPVSGPPAPNAAQQALIRRSEQQSNLNAKDPVPEPSTVPESKPVIEPGKPTRLNGVDAVRGEASQEVYNKTATETRELNSKSNTTVSMVYPVIDTKTGQVFLERLDNLTPMQAKTLLDNLESQGRLPEGSAKQDIFFQNGIGGKLPDGKVLTPAEDLAIRDTNLYFESFTPDQVSATLQKSVPPMNGKVGTVFSPENYGDLLRQTVPANDKERGNVSLAVPVQMGIPYDSPIDSDGKPNTTAPVNATLLYPDLTPSEAGALLKAFSDAGILRSSVDGVLAQNGLSQGGLKEREVIASRPAAPRAETPEQPEPGKEAAPETTAPEKSDAPEKPDIYRELEEGEADFIREYPGLSEAERELAAEIIRQRPSTTPYEAVTRAQDAGLGADGGGSGNNPPGRVGTAANPDEPDRDTPPLDNITIVRNPDGTIGITPDATENVGQAGSAEATNEAIIERVKTAPIAELNDWLGSMPPTERQNLPTEVQEALWERWQTAMEQGRSAQPSADAGNIQPLSDTDKQALMRISTEIMNTIEVREDSKSYGAEILKKGPFVAILADSGSGALVAYVPTRQALDDAAPGRVTLIAMGDHQNQPYGSKTTATINYLVDMMVRGGVQIDPEVIAFACNTACLAIFDAQRRDADLAGPGIPKLNLIDNTARFVATTPEVFGGRPVILSTSATQEPQLIQSGSPDTSPIYDYLIDKYSDGETRSTGVGASAPPVPNPNGDGMWKRDLATLVNEGANRDPARADEVQAAVDYYVSQMPEDMTSLVLCCTHYPALIPQLRKALDDRGMQGVPIIDPMANQARAILKQLAADSSSQPEQTETTPAGPDAVVSSATGRSLRTIPERAPDASNMTPEQREALINANSFIPDFVPDGRPYTDVQKRAIKEQYAEVAMEDLIGVVNAIEGITSKDMPLFFGQLFGDEFRPDVLNRFISGETSALDTALTGFSGRKLDTFYNYGAVPEASERIQQAETVMYVTGFNVPPNPDDPNSRPAPETDGIAGTAAAIDMTLKAGKKVTAVTDAPNNVALKASLEALGVDTENNPNLTLKVMPEGDQAQTSAWAASALNELKEGDVVVAVELPGRNENGTRTNMGGTDIDGYNLPLDELILQANQIDGIGTIGFGDGGNEAGMGNLDLSKVKSETFFPSQVPADIAVTSPDSNLGAFALGAQLLSDMGLLDNATSPEDYWSAVEASVDNGAVDGVTRKGEATVDGFPKTYHMKNLQHVLDALNGTWPPAALDPNPARPTEQVPQPRELPGSPDTPQP